MFYCGSIYNDRLMNESQQRRQARVSKMEHELKQFKASHELIQKEVDRDSEKMKEVGKSIDRDHLRHSCHRFDSFNRNSNGSMPRSDSVKSNTKPRKK